MPTRTLHRRVGEGPDLESDSVAPSLVQSCRNRLAPRLELYDRSLPRPSGRQSVREHQRGVFATKLVDALTHVLAEVHGVSMEIWRESFPG